MAPREKLEEDEAQVELSHRRPNPDASRSRVFRERRYFKSGVSADGHRGTSTKHVATRAKAGDVSETKQLQRPFKERGRIKPDHHFQNTSKVTSFGSASRVRVPVESKDRSYNVHSLTNGEIFSFCSKDPESVVNGLYIKIKAFQSSLQESQKIQRLDIMDALVFLLSKVAKCLQGPSESSSQASLILGEALSVRCHAFQLRLKLYVSRDLSLSGSHPVQNMHLYTIKAKVERVLELFQILLASLPDSSWSILPVLELQREVCRLSSSYQGEITTFHEQQAKQIVEHLNEISDEKCRLSISEENSLIENTRDNSEYRQVPILPRWEEISSVDYKFQLRPNIIHGCYSDWLHYYNIHFHLLREDFIAPLRRGICCFLQGARGRKLQDVKAYEHVRITEPVISSEGVSYELQFDIRHLKRCKWEHSKRLLYGALLCLSPDNFKETVLFATVSRREPDELRKGKVLVRFEGDYNIQMYMSFRISFSMVESLAYFEACRHTLLCLQQTEVDTMPFSQYILQNECKSVSPPSYIARNPEVCYNLSCLLNDTSVEETDSEFEEESDYFSSLRGGISTSVTERHVKLLVKHQWPGLQEMELDSSQLEAIQMALTQEIAVIQGPPGTGKTYIGLKAVQVLLTNRQAWDPEKESPIVVMCLTNHALDQFLEGILAVFDQEEGKCRKPKIVRVGGRSKSEVIQNLNITKVVKSVFIPRHINEEVYRCKDDVNLAVEKMTSTRSRMLRFSKPYLFSLHELQQHQVISPQHYYQLGEELESPEELKKALEIWLGIYQISCQLPQTSDTTSIHETVNMENNSVVQQNSKDTSTKMSNSKMIVHDAPLDSNENKDQSKEDVTGKTIPSDDEINVSDINLPPQSTSQVKRDPNDELNSDDETSDLDEEELIDVKGEASMEQEARLVGTHAHGWLRLSDILARESDAVYETDSRITQDTLAFDDNIFEDNEPTDDHTYGKKTSVVPIRSLHRCEYANKVIAEGRAYGPMQQDELTDVQNINHLDHVNRWRLYNYWINCCVKQLSESYEDKLGDYDRLCRRKKEAMQRADRYALETADVVGMTTTGAAKYQHVLHLVKPKIIVVEEAAEVLESHIVAGLTAGTQHLILIGDHKQLRPKPNEYELAKKYKLDISLFERLILNNFPHATLQIQHRMRPEIAQLVKPHIYSTLINHESVQKYDNVNGIDSNLYFIQHEFPEMDDENLISHSNQHEAQFLTALCDYLLKQGYRPSQITILVTYSGQLLLMRSHMPRATFEGVRVCTVDNFQGEENDIILLSLVRSNAENKIGFLREENRVCVALSRAKIGFYCIGNLKMLRDNAPIWETILSDMERKNRVGESLPLHCTNHSDTRYVAKTSNDFKQFSPNGGCLKNCEYRLLCGHACVLKCHIQDPEHKEYSCRKPCAKKCKEGHPCQRLCYELCKCMVKVTRTMPVCGHPQEMYCYEDLTRVKCMNLCNKRCPNDHLCPQLCHEWCRPCRVIMQKEMPKCGHIRPVECYSYSTFNMCDADCEKKCDNGHCCLKKCHQPCGRCEVKISKKIPICGHSILLKCYSSPDHSLCTQQCDRLLACGHRCPRQCSLPCVGAVCEVRVNVTLDCGHSVSMQCCESKSLGSKFCDKPCQRTLSCGHKCTMKCGQPCTQQCMKKVIKRWPCGHELKRPCYQLLQPSNFPCKKKCKTILHCGHSCPNECGMPCTDTCKVMLNKECPCGHANMIVCSVQPIDFKCSQRCKVILSCGHRCDGKCSQCFLNRIHKPCRYENVGVRFCGHRIQVPSQDVSDRHPGRKVCTSSCAHVKCERDCTVKCLPCDLPCAWSCPHFKCTKLCYEICDRPVCNKRCGNVLTCGHQCFGVCGEPCLSICPLCQRKKFNKKLKLATFSDTKLYIQLPCDHILTIEFLDKSVSEQLKTKRVLPLLCPVNDCYHRIPTSYRYGNVAKESLHDVTSVIQIINDKRVAMVLEVKEILQLASRIEGLLQRHVSIQSGPIRNWKNLGLYRDPTDGKFRRYDPLPRISSDLLMLQKKLSHPDHRYNIQGQERFIIYLLLNIVHLLNIVSVHKLKEVSLSDIEEPRSLQEQLQIFAWYVVQLWKKFSSRLSHQTVIDLQSEVFRLNILVQYCFLSSLNEVDQPLSSSHILRLKAFLLDSARNHMLKVTYHQYAELTIAGQHVLSGTPSLFNHEQLLSDIDRSLPTTTKGDWWKCINGHYYCTPFTMDGYGHKEPICPYCV